MAGQATAIGIGPAPRTAQRSQWEMALERFRAHRPATAGLLVLGALALLCAAAPLVSPYDPESVKLSLIHEGPSLAHPFGTDSLGRDLATRILYGGRVSLSVGLLTVTVAISVGTLVGTIAGYYGRWPDSVLMRLVDMMYSFPRLFLLILFGVFFKGMTLGVIVVVLGLLSWMTTARLVRASFLSLKHREFVEAARCVGARDRRIIVRHILPNSLAPIIVAATLGVASAIIAESTLSFLGLGIQPPTPSWGNMLKDAPSEMNLAPWVAIFPGLFIFLAVVSINFIGDGLRDALDPRHVTRRG
ncbi:MAG TPA: oligopeptide ABC transporter permease [Candidatus Limnocylindria bacterium]|jgi:peptide/nickel transport system permease protein|nr:oligopeptide ABC transporter permease [Candidatus Limnocylindria bacterium]